MNGKILSCWRCGQQLTAVIFPMSRREECQACGADQHVCKLCSHYSPGRVDDCSEDRAEAVTNKELANYCDYFDPTEVSVVTAQANTESQARAELEALFGNHPVADGTADSTAAETVPTEASQARAALDDLFNKD
jgi:hypothetical protein